MAATHELIRKTAIAMAEELYDDSMLNDALYAEARKRSISRAGFINWAWPRLVPEARTTLVRMLTTNISDELKDQITDALIKDRSLFRGGPLPH